ncbi:MAG: bifunctional folylpolyglutamate synthase/dihydrofolate synthase [Chloroflexi bacterium]|nr:bifunctional folylpolyglutamate synthase/dihydrofolate synthase [Chloroflexota bacterium]
MKGRNMAMDYKQAVDYVLGLTDYEKVPAAYTPENYDLKRMETLLDRLGNPHLAAKSIHIAGTKGKGSTAAMMASALSSSGFVTGLFTSPHLLSIRERFKVDDNFITEDEFTGLVKTIQPHVEHTDRQKGHGKLTTFEVLTAMAFTYFKSKKVQFQVIEAGLGGRLDATNLVQPEVCVLAPISLDHTQILGNTIAKIAAEKAGIIKKGSKVVSAPQPDEAMKVIEDVCKDKKARLTKVGVDVTWQLRKANMRSQYFQVTTQEATYNLIIPLLGGHQLENATTAVTALEVLSHDYPAISPQSMATGLARVYWPGRLQILLRRPLVVADGAHNAQSMARLREAIGKSFRYEKLIIIMGTSLDKDIHGMVEELAGIADTVIVTRAKHPRAMDPKKLEAEFATYRIQAKVETSVADAVKYALSVSDLRDLVVATGSLFVVGETIAYLDQVAPQ